MTSVVLVITALIAIVCIVVITVFYNLTKLQEEVREKNLELESYRMERWDMTKQLAACVESALDDEKKMEGVRALFDRDYMLMSQEEKAICFQKMEEVLGKLLLMVKNQSSLQNEEKVHDICKSLKDKMAMYHNAEMYYERSVRRLNDKIDKVPERYVARIFGIQKETGLK